MEEILKKIQEEQFELLNKDLPDLLHRILIIRLIPGVYAKELLQKDIEKIKKITNAECDNALSYLKQL